MCSLQRSRIGIPEPVAHATGQSGASEPPATRYKGRIDSGSPSG
jgi:hypothetical protein